MPSANDNTDELTRRRKGGEWLKAQREITGLDQKQIAERLGLRYYTFIAQLENGQAHLPDAMVENYARALDLPHDKFLAHHLYFFHRPEIWKNSDFVKSQIPDLA